jgi:hypothetical protein
MRLTDRPMPWDVAAVLDRLEGAGGCRTRFGGWTTRLRVLDVCHDTARVTVDVTMREERGPGLARARVDGRLVPHGRHARLLMSAYVVAAGPATPDDVDRVAAAVREFVAVPEVGGGVTRGTAVLVAAATSLVLSAAGLYLAVRHGRGARR